MPRIAESREIDELSERMLRVLESQRRLGGDAYPPTLERLAELSGVKASSPNVPKAAGKNPFKDRAIVAWNRDRKPARDSVVFLTSRENFEEAVAEVAPAVLVTLLQRARGKSTEAFSISDLGKKLTARLQAPFKAAIGGALERRSLPSVIGSIKKNNTRLLFLLEAVETSAVLPSSGPNGQASPSQVVRETAPAGATQGAAERGAPLSIAEPDTATAAEDFAPSFREAFDRLDRANRSTNFVRLLDLRRELSGFDRERFDAGLRRLRLDDEFTLDSHEGRHEPLSDEEREAGIREAGSLLVYVSRRS